MTEEIPSPKSGCSGRSVGIALLLSFIFLFLPAIGNTSIGEILFRLVAGWAFHVRRNSPLLADYWSSLLFPLGCLVTGLWFFHRFAVWWLHEKAPGVKWRPRHSMAALGILLGISGAAIAMSGITHQSAWMMSEQWTEDRGRKGIRSLAVSNAKILGLALFEYHDAHGRYPATLDELSKADNLVNRVIRMPATRNGLPEPFLFLKPGASEFSASNEVVLISPYIPESDCWVVGFGDASARPVNEPELNKLLIKEKR